LAQVLIMPSAMSGWGPMCASAWSAAFCILLATPALVKGFSSGIEPSTPRFPPCRKSADLHALKRPGGGQVLVAFGGKGYDWSGTAKGGKGGKGEKLTKRVHILGDTWLFDMDNDTWREQVPHGRQHEPVKRWKSVAAAFDGDQKLAMFGGCQTTPSVGVLNDVWVFDAGGWRQVQTTNPPRRRRGHVVAANSSHLVIFGGKTYSVSASGSGGGVCIKDLWALPLSALAAGNQARGTWTRGKDFPGDCFWGASGTVLTKPDGGAVLAVFGGRFLHEGAGFHSTAASAYTYFSNLWLYDFAADSWSIAKTHGPVPHSRDHHGAANVDGDVFIFGGRVKETREADSDLNDVWSYNLVAEKWTKHPKGQGASPAARFMPGVASVTWRGRSVLAVFGGESLPGASKRTTLNDIWIYDPSFNSGWVLLSPSRCNRAMVGDEEDEEDDDDDIEELAEKAVPLATAALAAEANRTAVPALLLGSTVAVLLVAAASLWPKGRPGAVAVAAAATEGEADAKDKVFDRLAG